MAEKKKEMRPDGSMTFLEHMSELRKCLVIIAGVFLAAAVGGYFFAPQVTRLCLDLAKGYSFVQISPAELLGQYVKVAFILGLVVAVPVFIWQANRFAKPGLKKSEDRVFLGVMLSGVFFFALGATFCYTVVAPLMLQFFLGLNTIGIQGMYSVKEYMNYLIGVLTAFGVIFEIPVLSCILAFVGLLKPETMMRGRKAVIVICFIVGAAITPTDVVSQLLVAVPMCLLFYFSILLVKMIAGVRRKRHPEEAETEEEERQAMRSERKSRWERAMAMAEAQEQAEKEKA